MWELLANLVTITHPNIIFQYTIPLGTCPLSVIATSVSTILQKTNCAYHTNDVLYGTVGVLITHFTVSNITPYFYSAEAIQYLT